MPDTIDIGPQNVDVSPEFDVNGLLDIADNYVRRIGDSVENLDRSDIIDIAIVRVSPLTPDEKAQRAEEVLRKYEQVRSRLEELLSPEELKTLNIENVESAIGLDILRIPPLHEGTMRITFERDDQKVVIEEPWEFEEDMNERPEPPSQAINLEDAANGDSQSDQLHPYTCYIREGRENAQHEALERVLARLEAQEEEPSGTSDDEPSAGEPSQANAPSQDPSAPADTEPGKPEEPNEEENKWHALINKFAKAITDFIKSSPFLSKLFGLDENGDTQGSGDSEKPNDSSGKTSITSDILGNLPVDPGHDKTIDPGSTIDPGHDIPLPGGVDPSIDLAVMRYPSAEEMKAKTAELLAETHMERVRQAIDALDLSETERASVVVDVQHTTVVQTLPPYHQGTATVSFVPDATDGTVGEESDRVGSVVGWEYQGVRRTGGQDRLLGLEDTVDDLLGGLPPGEANAEEESRRNAAVEDALLQAIRSIQSGNTEPITIGLGFDLDPGHDRIPGDPDDPDFLDPPPSEAEEPEEPEGPEKERVEHLESLLKLAMQNSLLGGKESERAFVRNGIFVEHSADGYMVTVDMGLMEGRLNNSAMRALTGADLFAYVNTASKRSSTVPMTLVGLEAFVSNFEVRLGLEEPPPDLGQDYIPPPDASSYTPRMTDAGRRIEHMDQASRYYTITPPLAADFRSGVYGEFRNGEWTQEEPQLTTYQFTAPDNLRDIHTISGHALGNVAVPLPHGYRLQVDSLRVEPSVPVTISEDQHGVAHLTFQSDGAVTYSIDFGQDPSYELNREPTDAERSDMVDAQGLGSDTQDELERVGQMPNVGNIEKAREFLHYIKENFYYSTSDDVSDYIMGEGGANYVERVDSHDPRMADCDVANTYFVALCREAGIPARLSVGFSSSRDNDQSILGPVNGHGWAEVWDGDKWVKFDATPDRTQGNGDAPDEPPEQDPALLAGDVDLGSDEYHELIRNFEQMPQQEGLVGNFDSVSNPQFNRNELTMWYNNSKVRVRNGSTFFTLAKVDTYRDDGTGNLVYNRSRFFATNVYHTPANLSVGPSFADAKQSAQRKARSHGFSGVRFTV